MQKPKLTLDFNHAWLIYIKATLHQHLSLYHAIYFVLFTKGKPADKKNDVDYRYQPSLSAQMQ